MEVLFALYDSRLSLLSIAVGIVVIGYILKTRSKRIWPRGERFLNGQSKRQLEHVSVVSAPPEIKALVDFDWTKQEPQKLRPFKPVYHITMGLRADDPSDLIIMDKNYLNRITMRRQLISQHGTTVHGYVAGGEDAVRELYTSILRDLLPRRFPTMFKLSEHGRTFHNLVTGRAFPVDPPTDTAEALRILGETVEDDMFLLKDTPQGHQSVAFICCFPSGFNPSKKLGKGLKAIHDPVPSYEKIGPSMERFFGKVEVGKNVKRMNWSIQTHPDLFDCDRNHVKDGAEMKDVDSEVDIDQTFARMELQTLSRLPETRALLFSFKTYLYPLREIKEEGSGPEVADAIQGLKSGNAPGMWVYKGGVRWAERVCQYLRS